jgi:hypothetical protein
MLLLEAKSRKVLVMIIGHNNPHFLQDSAEAFMFYHRDATTSFEVVFAIDCNKESEEYLVSRYGQDYVFNSRDKNGWGRGILRTIIHAMDYFEDRFYFSDMMTMDSDALCIGPCIDIICDGIEENDLYSGLKWPLDPNDRAWHFRLQRYAPSIRGKQIYPLLSHKSAIEGDGKRICAGPCMFWTKMCLDILKESGFRPGKLFDNLYRHIYFPHDQISTFLYLVSAGNHKEHKSLYRMKWSSSLDKEFVEGFGDVPSVDENVCIIHPTGVTEEEEVHTRKYFKHLRDECPSRIV